jgi:hypothetical protein
MALAFKVRLARCSDLYRLQVRSLGSAKRSPICRRPRLINTASMSPFLCPRKQRGNYAASASHQVILPELADLCVARLHSPYPKRRAAFASVPSVSSAAAMEACPIEHGLTKLGGYLLSRTSLAG